MTARTRMLTFRVTDREFEQLQAAASAAGARCLSEYLRQSAVRFSRLEERVAVLETRIADPLESRTAKE